jgi:hypothetical protein
VIAVLGLAAVIALLAAGSLYESLFGRLLAGTRLYHQRAWALSDLGTSRAFAGLGQSPPPDDYSVEQQPLAGMDEHVVVSLRSVGVDALPAGFSAGRFVMQRYEIEAVGHSLRDAQAVQVQGVSRVLPATMAETP